MDNFFILLCVGFLIGTLGTLIGAGGGFILVPLLLLTHPELTPEVVTAISMGLVACNAISGSIAYARIGRIDYRAGLLFAVFTIPGSILGVMATKYVSQDVFQLVFGGLLIVLSIFLFVRKKATDQLLQEPLPAGMKKATLTDRAGTIFSYAYNQKTGILISVLVGFLSPILGIGGGIIHVPAMVHWLHFPVYIATATSHFILAIMSSVSVIVHAINGNYNDPQVLKMVIALCIGAMCGAQLGAFLSHRIKGKTITKALAVCLGIVGLRLLLSHFL